MEIVYMSSACTYKPICMRTSWVFVCERVGVFVRVHVYIYAVINAHVGKVQTQEEV